MKTSKPSRAKGLAKSTPSAEASPAKTFPSPGRAPDSPESEAGSGVSMLGLLAKFDPVSSSWKTSQRSLFEDLEPSSVTWPRSGTTLGGTAFPLVPLAPLTAVTGSGLLPTPEASNTKASAMRSGGRSPRDFLKLLPTPRATDGSKGARSEAGALKELARGRNMDLGMVARLWPTPHGFSPDGRSNGPSGNELGRAVNRSLWATPTISGNHNRKGASPTSGDGLATQAGGSLNPTWVEWLMGFPLGWTDCMASATRSSRKSRN